MTELNIIDFDKFQGSCDSAEMKRNLTAEWLETSPLQFRYEDIAHKLAILKGTENDNPDLARAKRAHLMSELAATKIKLNEQKAQLTAIIEKNNQALTRLYNLREASKNINDDEKKEGFKGIDAQIEFDQKGNPFLKVSKQMDGGVGFDFTITGDGKVVFPQMSDDKIKELLDFLYRRGITNFELPQGAPQTPEEAQKRVDEGKAENLDLDKETLEKIKEEISTENTNRKDPNYIDEEGNQQSSDNMITAMTEEEYQNSVHNQETPSSNEEELTAASTSNQASASTSAAPAPKKNNEKYYEDAVKDLKDWGHDILGKQDGFGMHQNFSGNTFSFYQDNSKDWFKNDGKIDKNDQRHEDGLLFRVKLHKNPDTGKLGGISYYVPKNGKIPDNLAGKLVGLVKSQGALYMNFPKTMIDGDAAVFRKACAQQGIIPTGKVTFNENQARNMIKEADANLNKSDALKYKGRLGKYILEQEQKKDKPNADMLSYATQLVNEEKFTPLKEFCDPLFKEISENSNRTGIEAKEIIGSANAVKRLYDIFDTKGQQTLGSCGEFTSDQLRTMNIDINTPIENLNKEQLYTIYSTLQKQETTKAENQLNSIDPTYSNKEYADAVKEYLGEAQGTINGVINKFDDNNLKGLRCSLNKNTPKHPRPAPTRTSTAMHTAGGYSDR